MATRLIDKSARLYFRAVIAPCDGGVSVQAQVSRDAREWRTFETMPYEFQLWAGQLMQRWAEAHLK